MSKRRAWNLRWFLREARRRPPGFLVRKAGDVLRRGLRVACAAAGRDPYSPRWRGSRERRPLLDAAATDALVDLFAAHWPDELRAHGRYADETAAGRTRVLHHTLRTVPVAHEWHQDFVSGHGWPVKYHGRYSYAELLDLDRPSDVKVPWELSRLQALPALALAYRRSGDKRYLCALIRRFRSWRTANPVGYGINWTVGMEVSLRAVNLVVTADLLEGTQGQGLFEQQGVNELLAGHGRHLYRNQEYSDINGNHYTACLLGLFVLGLTLPVEREAADWLRTAVANLKREVLSQVYPDGVCHEGSIPYHCLVLDLFLRAEQLARRHGIDFGVAYRKRLEAMLDFVAATRRPDGDMPIWGDNDDGRVLQVTGHARRYADGLLAAGGALLEREDLAACGRPTLDVLLTDGARSARWLAQLPERGDRRSDSDDFRSGGFFVLRRGGDYCLVDCGDVGLRGRGGHGHNDALSCEVCLAGLPVLVDTGCAAYSRSRDDRVFTLSASAHNVATVAGSEPSPLDFNRFPHATACPVEVLSWEPEVPAFTGRHLGYKEQGRAGAYQRRLELKTERGALLIADRVEASGEATAAADPIPTEVTWHFQLAERWQPDKEGEGWVTWADGTGHRLRLDYRLRGAQIRHRRVPWFPAYGVRRERWRLLLNAECALPIEGRFHWHLR